MFLWQRTGKDSLNVGGDGATTVCADFPATAANERSTQQGQWRGSVN